MSTRRALVDESALRTVEVQERLAAPAEVVWSAICDFESYPRVMPSVRALTILERGNGWSVTAWEVELRGSILKWVEREEIDRRRYRVTYRQVDGDLQRFEGYWQLHPHGDVMTDATLVVHFDIGIPMLAEILNPVAERAIADNARRMLRALEPGSGKAS